MMLPNRLNFRRILEPVSTTIVRAALAPRVEAVPWQELSDLVTR